MTLTDAQLIRIGRTIAAVAVLLAVGGLVTAIALGRWQSAVNTVTPINASVGVGFGALAWTVLPKQPRNRSVWAYTVAAFFGGLYSAVLVPLVLAIPTDVEAGANARFPLIFEWPSAIAAHDPGGRLDSIVPAPPDTRPLALPRRAGARHLDGGGHSGSRRRPWRSRSCWPAPPTTPAAPVPSRPPAEHWAISRRSSSSSRCSVRCSASPRWWFAIETAMRSFVTRSVGLRRVERSS